MSDITDKYSQDIVARVGGRRLPQLKEGTVRCGILNEQARQLQELYDAVVSALDQRVTENARGLVLGAIGRIVGQPRILLNQAEKNWLTPDAASGRPDTTPAWTEGAPLSGNLEATDSQYIALIGSKIFKNHVKHGSIPEVIEFVRILYGVNISIKKLGLSQIGLVVPSGVPEYVVTTIISTISDERADNQHFLPHCPTVSILTVTYGAGTGFAPDRLTGRPEVGRAAVTVTL